MWSAASQLVSSSEEIQTQTAWSQPELSITRSCSFVAQQPKSWFSKGLLFAARSFLFPEPHSQVYFSCPLKACHRCYGILAGQRHVRPHWIIWRPSARGQSGWYHSLDQLWNFSITKLRIEPTTESDGIRWHTPWIILKSTNMAPNS